MSIPLYAIVLKPNLIERMVAGEKPDLGELYGDGACFREVVELATIGTYQQGYLDGWRAALEEVRQAGKPVSIHDLIGPEGRES